MNADRARHWLNDLFVHNAAEAYRTSRAVERRAHDVALSDLPYPGTVQGSGNTTNNVSGRGWLVGPVLGLLLAAAGAAGGLWVAGREQLPVTRSPSVLPSAAPYEYDEVQQVQEADGSWSVTSRTRKRLCPDGTIQTRGEDGSWK